MERCVGTGGENGGDHENENDGTAMKETPGMKTSRLAFASLVLPGLAAFLAPGLSAAAPLDGRAHHRTAAVHGGERDAQTRHLRHCAFDRLADIVHFQIQKYLFPLTRQLAHEIHAGRGVEFHADLIERSVVAKPRDQLARLLSRFDIQGND